MMGVSDTGRGTADVEACSPVFDVGGRGLPLLGGVRCGTKRA